jgi:2-amino-4-hydroxy-6-hydroxymethyldihydropteridine diphosphokinase
MPDIYVGLGSNIHPVQNLRAAAAALSAEFGPLRLSSIYESAPVGFDGANFLNMVVQFSSSADCEHVHARLSALEEAAGRVRPSKGLGPRTLDLDLLLYGGRVDPAARLPHPDILAYPFVLWPLSELSPGLVHPLIGIAMEALRSRHAARGAGLSLRGSLENLAE